MQASILIIERQRDVADALADVVMSAHYAPIIRPHVERLTDLGVRPAAIIVRVAFEGISEPPHCAIARMASNRPPVVALVSEDNEVAEAERMKCDVVLRTPGGVSHLRETLTRLVCA